MLQNSPQLHAVRIEKIIAGGMGLARTASGHVIMSGLVLPGEVAQLREVRRKAGYLEAELAQVLEPSAERVLPACPQHGHCGGCDLQHCSYAEQLRIKQAIVAEAMQRAHVPLPSAGIDEAQPSPRQWGYRHRVRLHISPAGELGFFRKKSHAVAAVSNCPAAAAEINTAAAELAAAGCLSGFQELELHCSPRTRRITLVLPLRGRQRLPAVTVQQLAACSSINQIGCTNDDGFRHLFSRTGTAEPLTQEFNLPKQNCLLSWSGGCFSQVNPCQNAQLVRLLLDVAGQVQGKNILDLYCGMGNFSVPLVLAGSSTLLGVEGSQESVRWARRNAATAGVSARFLAADVHSCLWQLVSERQQMDIILLDPPRAGIGKTAALLPELRAEKIIYISCDPVTLARDLAVLCGKGFQVIQLTPLDMFPQTSHIETIAVLENTAG